MAAIVTVIGHVSCCPAATTPRTVIGLPSSAPRGKTTAPTANDTKTRATQSPAA
jgi:hypothetical protein